MSFGQEPFLRRMILYRYQFLLTFRLHLLRSAALARLSLERTRSSDKKSRKINKLERIIVAKVCQLLRNSL